MARGLESQSVEDVMSPVPRDLFVVLTVLYRFYADPMDNHEPSPFLDFYAGGAVTPVSLDPR